MFQLGTDPELVLIKENKHFSAIPIVNTTAEKPLVWKGHSFFYDNVLAECGIKPGNSKAEVVKNIREALQHYAQLVKPYKLVIQAAATYESDQMTNKDSRIVGCRREWDAYTLQVIEPPKSLVERVYNRKEASWEFLHATNFRTAGGHIHLGDTGILQDSWKKPFIVYMLDLFLGIPSLFLDKDPTSKNRRNMYGLAGSHRATDYGLEYRPLSAFWLENPQKVELVWDICAFVLNFVSKGSHKRFWDLDEDLLDEDDPSVAYNCFGYDKDDIQEAINTCNTKMGEKFMLIVERYLPNSLMQRIEKQINEENKDFYEAWEM